MSVKVSPAFVKDSVSQRPGTMDYLTLKPGSMDYLTSAKPTSLDYFSAYASMLDRTRMYFQGLPQVRPFEGRVATAADLAPLLAGGREREIPLDLSMGTIRQTPDSTAVDDDVIVLEHKKAAAAAAAGARAHALSKLQAEAARHGARLSDAFLPPVGATFPHNAKKACQHNGVTPTLSGMMPNPLGSLSCSQTSTASGVTVTQAGTEALVSHLPGHLGLLSHPVHSAGTCSSDGALCVDFPRCRTGNDFIPTSLGSLAAQHPMHRAQALQTMAALGGLHGLTASSAASQSYDRSVPKLIPLCPSQNNTSAASALSQELGLSELHRLGLAAGATANFLLPPSCAGAMGMPLSKQLGERYLPIPPHGYPKENACPCCPPTGLPIPCACCVPKQSSSRGAGAFTAYTDACCPPKEMPFAMSALYNGGFTSGLSSSGKDKESVHGKSAVKESRHAKRDSSSFSTSSASTSGNKGSSSSSTAKEAVSVVVSKEASFPMTSSSSSSSSLVNRSTITTSTSSSTTTTLTSSTTSTATSLPIDTHHHSHPHHVAHHAFQTSAKMDSRVLEGCARTDGRDKRSMTLAQKEMESARMARTSNDISSSSSATTISTATTMSSSNNVTKTNRIYAPLASIPTIPGDKDSIIVNHLSRVEPKPIDITVQNPDVNNSINCTVATTTTTTSINNGCETIPSTSHESSRPEPPHPSTGSDAHMLSVAPFPDEFRRPVVIDAVIYPPRDTLHVNGLPAVPKDSHSPAKAEEVVRKHPGIITVWRPGNWDDEPPKYPSPSPKEAVVPSVVKDKGAPVPMSPRGASLPEEAREPEVTSSESSVAEPIKSELSAVNVSPEEQVLSAEYGPSALLPPERKLSVVEELVQKYRKKYVENRMLQRLLVNIKRPKPPTCNGAVLPYLIADKKNTAKRKSEHEPTSTNKRFKVIWNEADARHKMEPHCQTTPYLNDETLPAASIDHVPMMYPVQDDTDANVDRDKNGSFEDRKYSKSRRFDGIWKKRHDRIQKIIIKMRANNNNNNNNNNGSNEKTEDGVGNQERGNKMDNFVSDSVQTAANPGDFSIEKEHYESNAVLDNTEKLIVRLYYGRRRFGFGHRRRYRSGFDYIRSKKKTVKKYAYEAHPKHMGRLANARFNAEYISDKESKLDQSKMKLVNSSPGRSPNCVPLEMKRLMINKTLGETVLHRAARQGYTEVVLYCLETKYVEIDSKDNAGYTPLHECCARGHLQIARFLLQYGADVNASAAGGIRPIHDAVENDRVEVVRLLLSYGADPLLATYSGLTPIKIAHSQSMLELLKGFLADVTGETTEAVQPWQFNGSARCFDSPETGYDVFDDLPSDIEESDDRNDITFEISDRPHIQTYILNRGSSSCHGPETFCLLDDVLRKIGQSREQFLHYHVTAHVISLPRNEFLQSIENSQLIGENEALLADDVYSLPNDVNPPVEMVKLDDALRHLLGVETVVISTHE